MKNDWNDAAAICEAAQRPTMRLVTTKSLEQQDLLAIHRIRERLVDQRICTVLRQRREVRLQRREGPELLDWAMERRGEYFILSVYRELGENQRWQPEYLDPDALMADAFGRVRQALNALPATEVPPDMAGTYRRHPAMDRRAWVGRTRMVTFAHGGQRSSAVRVDPIGP